MHTFTLRVSPELAGKIKDAAYLKRISVNKLLEQAAEKEAEAVLKSVYEPILKKAIDETAEKVA